MKIENQRLREMLSQATNNFNSLQMQLVAVMRQQEQRNSSQDHLLVILHLPFKLLEFYVIDHVNLFSLIYIFEESSYSLNHVNNN